jgi:hypothetical protein
MKKCVNLLNYVAYTSKECKYHLKRLALLEQRKKDKSDVMGKRNDGTHWRAKRSLRIQAITTRRG